MDDWSNEFTNEWFQWIVTFYWILYWGALPCSSRPFHMLPHCRPAAAAIKRSWKWPKLKTCNGQFMAIHNRCYLINVGGGGVKKTVETTGAKRPCATFDFAQSCRVCDNMPSSRFATKHLQSDQTMGDFNHLTVSRRTRSRGAVEIESLT